MKKLLPTLLLCLSPIACTQTTSPQNTFIQTTAPKNIIMIIGDGMGPAYTSAYRYFNDDPATDKIEQTVFDRHLVGQSSTYPARISGYITDSAAAATALATGVKTYNGAISVDVNKMPVKTVLEWAKKNGKKTGVIVTSQVNHATPASYLSHNVTRHNYSQIADSYIDNGIKADLILGGGWKYFIRKDRNLVTEFKEAGFHYIDKYEGLTSLPKEKPVLGLFADSGLPWALDDTNKHRLAAMTKAAVHHLEGENGYFMLIEASQIDWAGHNNDITSAMAEMDDLAKTLEYLEHYVEHHPDTLVVVTADHSTGGFSIGNKTGLEKSHYSWQPDILRTMTISPYAFAIKFANEKLSKEQTEKILNFSLSINEMMALSDAKGEAQKNIEEYQNLSLKLQKDKIKLNNYSAILVEIKNIIDIRTNTGWGGFSHEGQSSATHTAIDVPVFAFGPQSKIFSGFQDNTDIAKKIFTLLGKEAGKEAGKN